MKAEKCPECGSRNLGAGTFSGYANLTSTQGWGWRSSKVRAVVCADCGLILELRADKPERFMPKERD